MPDWYEDLAEVVSRDPKVHSGDLVVEGTRVPVDVIVEALASGDSEEEILDGYPSVSPDALQVLGAVWRRLCRTTKDEWVARGQLLAHADWAWISHRVAREIDARPRAFSRLYRPEELVRLAGTIVRHAGGTTPRESCETTEQRELVEALGEMLGAMQSDRAVRAADGLFVEGERGRITETLHCLTDAASSLRTAAGTLDGCRSVHADLARRLADDADRLVSDLEWPSAEP